MSYFEFKILFARTMPGWNICSGKAKQICINRPKKEKPDIGRSFELTGPIFIR
jgi:hypothetical protein